MSLGFSFSYKLRQSPSLKGPDDWDLIGNQLWLAIQFARSDFNIHLKFYDEIRAQRLPAGEIFEQTQEGLWIMRQDSVPGMIQIKAIGVTANKLMIETSPVSPVHLKKVIKTRGFKVYFNQNRRCLMGMDKEILAQLSDMRAKTKILEPRILWTVPWLTFKDDSLHDLVTILDALMQADIWIIQDRQEDGVDQRSPQMEMRQTFSLQMRIQVEQRPELMLDTRMQTIQIMDIQQILALQYKLLSMTEEELLAFATENPVRALNALLFTLAGKIKKSLPHLTWKEARRLARKAVNQVG